MTKCWYNLEILHVGKIRLSAGWNAGVTPRSLVYLEKTTWKMTELITTFNLSLSIHYFTVVMMPTIQPSQLVINFG